MSFYQVMRIISAFLAVWYVVDTFQGDPWAWLNFLIVTLAFVIFSVLEFRERGTDA